MSTVKLMWRRLNDEELSRMRIYLEDIKCVHASGAMSYEDYESKEEIIHYNFNKDNDCRSIMCKKPSIGPNRTWWSDYPEHESAELNGMFFSPYKFDINTGDYLYTCDYSEDILRNCPFLYMTIFNINDKKMFQPQRRYFYWITITGKTRIDVNDVTVKQMYTFFKEFYTNEKWQRYHKMIWNIETGKDPDKPNLHHHALIVFNTTSKNFKRDISNKFKKIFKSVDYNESYFTMVSQGDIYKDKKDYLLNDEKSVCHQNYKDLKVLEILE